MGTFVLVHGGFGGGWEWTPVARLLRGRGHDVYTPTLTGLGGSAHIAVREPVWLSTHVQDIVGVLDFEDLHDVVMVGSGLGGVAVTSAADRAAHRVSHIIYLDALAPRDGECALDLLPPEFGAFVWEGVHRYGDTWRVPVLVDPLPQPLFATQAERSAHRSRRRDQPAMTLVESVYLTEAIDYMPRSFLRCTKSELFDEGEVDPIEAMVVRALEGRFHYRDLPLPHDPHVTHPGVVARVLDELSGPGRGGVLGSRAQVPPQTRRSAVRVRGQDVAEEKPSSG